MSWTNSKLTNLQSLPLVLAGPIVRRIDSLTASVWIAVSDPNIMVKLDVYDSASGTYTNTTKILSSTIVSVKKIGSNVGVVVVTASIFQNSNTQLDPGKIYHYNLTFSNSANSNFNNKNLSDPKILSDSGGIGIITYGSETLPSFSLPPSSLENLKIVHGSCRKPHGESDDAMDGIHEMLSANYSRALPTSTSNDSRPHLLFLTGDQIYADDVADGLLLMIRDVADKLLNINEVLPSKYASNQYSKNDAGLAPGNRSGYILKEANFSTEEDVCRSHLINLTDFYGMYLLAWSDTLWPVATSLPVYGDVFSSTTNDKEAKKRYQKQIDSLKKFQSSLVNCRKVFANVATYMIFDDHEITDDWFINRKWCLDVLGFEGVITPPPTPTVPPDPTAPTESSTGGSMLGTRIVLNGLLAYTLFQGWGNTPSDYTSGSAVEVINGAIAIAAGTDKWSDIKDYLLPTIKKNDTTAKFYLDNINNQKSNIKWHYKISFNEFEVLVMNNRTMRGYKGSLSPAELLSNEANGGFENHFPVNTFKSTNRLNILIAPTPVIGIRHIEKSIETVKSFYGPDYADFEAWGYNEECLQRFFATLADIAPVNATSATTPKTKQAQYLILSGDLHYGFSAKMNMQANNKPLFGITNQANQNININITQLTASALKNESSKDAVFGIIKSSTRGQQKVGFKKVEDLFYKNYFGWNNTTGKRLIGTRKDTGNDVYYTGNPLIISDLSYLYNLNQSDWSYSIDFIGDERNTKNFDNIVATGQTLYDYADCAKLQKSYLKKGYGKQIVGFNNVGEVTFKMNSGKLNIIQNTWWRLDSTTSSSMPSPPPLAPQPLTQTIIELI